jgi:hypothetical protein
MTIGLIEQKLDATDRSRAPAEITDCSPAGSGISRILQPSVFQDGARHKLPIGISTGCPFDRPEPTVIETHMSMKQLLARRMVSPRLQHGEIAYGPAIDDKIALFQQAPHTYACCMPVDRFNAAGAMTAANLVMAH